MYPKIHPFLVYNSVIFAVTFCVLCIRIITMNQLENMSITLIRLLVPIHSLPHFKTVYTTHLLSVSVDLPAPDISRQQRPMWSLGGWQS